MRSRALDRLLADPTRHERITHVEVVPKRPGRRATWPDWVPDLLVKRLALTGIDAPWQHQATAAELAHNGRSVIIATGTASGKSLAYLLPSLTAILGEAPPAPSGRPAIPQQMRPGAVDTAQRDENSTGEHDRNSTTQHDQHDNSTGDRDRKGTGEQDGHAVGERDGQSTGERNRNSTGERDRHGAGERDGHAAGRYGAVGDADDRPRAGKYLRGGIQQWFKDHPDDPVKWPIHVRSARAARRGGGGGPERTAGGPASGVMAAGRDSGGAAGRSRPAAGTVLYLAPTKALAADQLRALRALRLTRLRAATYDGDTPAEERTWVRQHANYVLTNPDMLHRSMLPAHARWATFLRELRYVIVDEAHGYRGVFGSHVAQVLRRLRRICARYGASPVFVLASATTAEPAATAARLTGLEVAAVDDDASPRGATTFALWEPPLTDLRGEHGAPIRRTATAEAADILADLVVEDVQTLTFVRSRRGAESVALSAKRALAEAAPELTARVAAYRAGFLPEERRELEQALRERELVGLATTNALELGVDVTGLDAVLVCGWPGTRASLWQQSGRAGRAGQDALAVLVARDDPLDTYLVHHPEAIFGTPVEATVLDPDNPYVLEPHLCAAAAELPLTEPDLEMFGPASRNIVPDLVRRGMLRRRPAGWFWTKRDRATDLADIRGAGGAPIQVVEAATGRLLGTVDEPSAHTTVHDGAVYLHQGESFIVRTLDLDDSVALVTAAEPDYSTTARQVTDISIVETLRTSEWGAATLCFGTVEVTRQVIAYQMRRLQTGELLGEEPLELPARSLRTRAVWWTLSDEQTASGAADLNDYFLAGAAHAAEHASIGLLPLFATCDRWDIGGVSTARHPDTGLLTVFVYDGHQGGAGFAERGYRDAAAWLRATRDAIAACECETGCPSCIQSPKCGNGNEPLDKRGALDLLGVLLSGAPTPSKVTNR